MVILRRRRTTVARLVTFLALSLLLSRPAARAGEPGLAETGQEPGTLVVRVTDTLDGVLPGATVTVEAAGAERPSLFETTDMEGQTTFPDLPPGPYRVQVDMPGFDPQEVDRLEVAAGRPTERAIVLRVGGFAEDVVVTRSRTERRLAESFSDTLPEEEIEQLPGDADELEEYLRQLAGSDAELRINGFEGGELPPVSQIQAIRIRDDPFAPDSRSGQPRVEIITKPGTSRWQHQVDVSFRDQSLDARHPLAEERGVGQTRRVGWSVSGPLVRDRTSIAVKVGTHTAFDAQNIVATQPDGELRDVVNRGADRLDVVARLEHGLTDTHTLRVEYQGRGTERDNLGVGEFDLWDRGYSEEGSWHRVRVSDAGAFGERLFNELRLQYVSSRNERQGASDEVTVDVQNAFRSGGAQVSGGSRERWIEIEDDLDVMLNDRHKLRMGVDGDLRWYRSDAWQNAHGTFTFASFDDYLAGRPRQFSQRRGDPLVEYSLHDLDWYVQDQIRVQKNLRLALGLRHEYQSLFGDWGNLGPRASLVWTPGGDEGKTTLRGGVGLSHGRYDPSVYEETRRVDGIRQQDLIVSDPGWPDPFADDADLTLRPPSRVQAADDLKAPATRRVSLDVQHDVTDALELRVNLFDRVARNRFRSVNVNAPVDGEPPHPELGRVTEVRSTGDERERGFELRMRLRTTERGTSGMIRYRHATRMNDADGAFSLPADSYNLAGEWGPAGGDRRHRFFGYVRMRLPRGVGVHLSGQVESATPYSIRTGFDDNRDTVFNDRPAGVGRNTERGDWHQEANLRLSWASDATARRQGARTGPRRGIELYTRVRNLFNTTNFTSYGGVMTSPYFGQPTAARDGRRLEVGTRVYF